MILRCLMLLLLMAITSHAERIEMECGFIEKTDRGLQCEFNNIFTFNSTEVYVTEKSTLIDAVSFRQSDLFTVPADIFRKFPQLKHLDVELTQIKEISGENFRNAKELKYFLARFNEIEELRSGTFEHCLLLKFIVLQYNLISYIHPNAFYGLSHLEAIYLDYNRVKTLPPTVLLPLTNLLHFSIAYNNLTTISNDLFMRNDKLETLNLGHNQISQFGDKQFENLPNLESIQLDHNNLRNLDLRTCKSTEINVDKNELSELELNKWTRFVSARGNPITKFTLHEHYGTGRNYNFSFDQVNEITFFVNENCCTKENLENFLILTQSFGDLSQKGFDATEWNCKFEKTIGYDTPHGFVVNNVCRKYSTDSRVHLPPSESPSTIRETFPTTTEWNYILPKETTITPRHHIHNQEDFIESDELESTTKPRESMEDSSPFSPSMFSGLNIETLSERRTTTSDPFEFTARVDEFFPSTTESYEEKNEKGIFKTVKKKVGGWKDKVVSKWNDWVG
ncbi:CLUMA_CG017883, isoform A [Clunio marinus]|uniref:CLUMA_CG017883, isoform A n=1 Tax=Clunio marinus TaxID=568069 RepID=A0A1J1J097_9DIPT|nr:CLUMA_CG017883, isoform A [Clunio marinus]